MAITDGDNVKESLSVRKLLRPTAGEMVTVSDAVLVLFTGAITPDVQTSNKSMEALPARNGPPVEEQTQPPLPMTVALTLMLLRDVEAEMVTVSVLCAQPPRLSSDASVVQLVPPFKLYWIKQEPPSFTVSSVQSEFTFKVKDEYAPEAAAQVVIPRPLQ